MECWQPVSYVPGHDIGTRTSRKRPVRREISHTTNYKRALVPIEPRGVRDGNGRRALLLNGGDGSERVVKSSGRGLGSCLVSSKSGNRHSINGALSSHSGREEPPIISIRGCLEKETENVEG